MHTPRAHAACWPPPAWPSLARRAARGRRPVHGGDRRHRDAGAAAVADADRQHGAHRRGARSASSATPTSRNSACRRPAPGSSAAREQESLPAIRSPVLTGPGSCGSFLMLEDGIPIRPAGFCNVNELFEIDTEQAAAMEVVRGPSSALYGANGLHGTLNFLLPQPGSAARLRRQRRGRPTRLPARARRCGTRRPAATRWWPGSPSTTTATSAPARATTRPRDS